MWSAAVPLTVAPVSPIDVRCNRALEAPHESALPRIPTRCPDTPSHRPTHFRAARGTERNRDVLGAKLTSPTPFCCSSGHVAVQRVHATISAAARDLTSLIVKFSLIQISGYPLNMSMYMWSHPDKDGKTIDP